MRSSLGVNCFSCHSMAIIKSIDLNEGRCFHLQTKSFKNLLLWLPSWQHSAVMAQLVCVTFSVRSTLPSSFHDELQLLVISLKIPGKVTFYQPKKRNKKAWYLYLRASNCATFIFGFNYMACIKRSICIRQIGLINGQRRTSESAVIDAAEIILPHLFWGSM